jgi:hypothetical protein
MASAQCPPAQVRQSLGRPGFKVGIISVPRVIAEESNCLFMRLKLHLIVRPVLSERCGKGEEAARRREQPEFPSLSAVKLPPTRNVTFTWAPAWNGIDLRKLLCHFEMLELYRLLVPLHLIFSQFFLLRELTNQRSGSSGEAAMKPTNDEDEKPAGAQLLAKRVRPTTIALAALIFGFAGVSALWLLVIAGLAALCSLPIASAARLRGSRPLILPPITRKDPKEFR